MNRPRSYPRSLSLLVVPLFLALIALLACEDLLPGASAQRAITRGTHVVLGFNDLGMHCMNQSFRELCILPPYNNLHAQVIQRGDEPRIIERNVQVKYTIPGNTVSTTKTDFWQYARSLFGVNLAPNIGLTGNGLSGQMRATGQGDWASTGIPITPIDDRGNENAYPLSTITVSTLPTRARPARALATTQAVVPVSWEISCNLCHNTPGLTVETDILRDHDRLHGTRLEQEKPVLCARCHSDPALGAAGIAGVSSMSSAMHRAHASRVSSLPATMNACYSCHPGNRTQCQRDVHFARGIQCSNCHGSMADVGNSNRRPWIDEPTCGSCHAQRKPSFQFEEPGKQFKESRGHHGVKCGSCHGSPHAITPTVTAADNVQAVRLQGFAGVIRDCKVCHTRTPDERFDHRLDDDGNGD